MALHSTYPLTDLCTFSYSLELDVLNDTIICTNTENFVPEKEISTSFNNVGAPYQNDTKTIYYLN
jgi:hypothetical protein